MSDVKELAADTGDHRVIVTAILLLSAAMLGWMARSLFTGDIPFTGDLLHFHYPVRQFYADALTSGGRFEWMPSLFNGFYLAGEGQAGTYHPLHWLLYRLLPLNPAFAIEIVVAYPCLFLGTFMFLRRWSTAAPAAFGAMLFTFCGFNLTHGVHPNMVGVIAHVPWVLWAIHIAATGTGLPSRLAGCALVGLLVGSQVLLGHPQALWLSLLIAGAYTAMVIAQRPAPARAGSALAVASGVLLGAAVGTIQLLATLYAAQRSVRQAYDLSYATSFSLPPVQLLQLVEPYLFWGRLLRWTEVPGAGDEYAAYGGAAALVLTAWWLARLWTRRHQGGLTPLDRLGLWPLEWERSASGSPPGVMAGSTTFTHGSRSSGCSGSRRDLSCSPSWPSPSPQPPRLPRSCASAGPDRGGRRAFGPHGASQWSLVPRRSGSSRPAPHQILASACSRWPRDLRYSPRPLSC